MRRILLVTLLAFASSIYAQAPKSEVKDEQQLLALIKEVKAQQAQIVENQAKMEAKLAVVTDAVRTARIYSSRSR